MLILDVYIGKFLRCHRFLAIELNLWLRRTLVLSDFIDYDLQQTGHIFSLLFLLFELMEKSGLRLCPLGVHLGQIGLQIDDHLLHITQLVVSELLNRI